MFQILLDNLTTAQFALIVTWLGCSIITLVVGVILSQKTSHLYKIFGIVAFGVQVALFLAFIIVSSTSSHETYVDDNSANRFGLYFCTIILILIIASFIIFFGEKKDVNHTKNIAYASISLATAFALHYVSLFTLPSGGKITLASLLPLLLYSYMFGSRRGTTVGIIFGFLVFIQEPFFVHPMQFLLDYPIAFASIGIAGILNEHKVIEKIKPLQFVLSCIIVVTIRYASHVISGIFVWGSGDPAYSVVAWSFLYNSFALIDMAISVVLGAALFTSKSLVSLMDKAAE